MKDIPAFPHSFVRHPTEETYITKGMTLRDYFAAQALTGAQIWDAVLNGKNAQLAQGGAEKLSDIAYAVADAMLKAREL
jgi:hypothetical protein